MIRAREWSSHKWDGCPYKRPQRAPSPLPLCEDQEKTAIYELGITKHKYASTLILDSPASRTMRSKAVPIINHLVYGVL